MCASRLMRIHVCMYACMYVCMYVYDLCMHVYLDVYNAWAGGQAIVLPG